MNYKEFYIWLEGFMTNRDWTVIREIDIDTILEKMKGVTDDPEDLVKNFLSKRGCDTKTQLFGNTTIEIKPRKDDEDLGKPPRIVM